MEWRIVLLSVVSALIIQSGQAKRKAKITNVGWKVVDGKYVIHLDGSNNDGDSYTWEVKTSKDSRYQEVGKTATLDFETGTPGTYKFKLTVVQSNGVLIRRIKSVKIKKNKSPVALAGMGVASIGTRYWMYLDGTSSKDDLDIASYTWTLLKGDNPGLELEGAKHTYDSRTPGIYQWELRVCDVLGKCSTDLAEEIKLNWVPPPTMKSFMP